jgi:hypothetical protein
MNTECNFEQCLACGEHSRMLAIFSYCVPLYLADQLVEYKLSYKNGTIARHGGTCLWSQSLEGRGRKIASSRPAWATQWVLGQPGLHGLSQKKKKKEWDHCHVVILFFFFKHTITILSVLSYSGIRRSTFSLTEQEPLLWFQSKAQPATTHLNWSYISYACLSTGMCQVSAQSHSSGSNSTLGQLGPGLASSTMTVTVL